MDLGGSDGAAGAVPAEFYPIGAVEQLLDVLGEEKDLAAMT
jgi:hypothetical protein